MDNRNRSASCGRDQVSSASSPRSSFSGGMRSFTSSRFAFSCACHSLYVSPRVFQTFAVRALIPQRVRRRRDDGKHTVPEPLRDVVVASPRCAPRHVATRPRGCAGAPRRVGPPPRSRRSSRNREHVGPSAGRPRVSGQSRRTGPAPCRPQGTTTRSVAGSTSSSRGCPLRVEAQRPWITAPDLAYPVQGRETHQPVCLGCEPAVTCYSHPCPVLFVATACPKNPITDPASATQRGRVAPFTAPGCRPGTN